MIESDPDLLRQEVAELTELVRSDPDWADLREVLRVNGLSPAEVILASFCEDEQGHECGLLVTPRGEIIEYERRGGGRRPGSDILKWRLRTGEDSLEHEYPQLPFALALLDDERKGRGA